MKTTHFRFTTPCSAVINAESILTDDPCSDGIIHMSPTGTAWLYDRHPELSQFLDRNKEDATQFIDDQNLLLKNVIRMELGDYGVFNSEFHLIHHVWMAGELDKISEEEIKAVEEYIMGQLSDGWGEGLEQREWMSESVTWTQPYFDEDSCEFDKQDVEETAYYYLKPWDEDTEIEILDSAEEELEVEAEELANIKRVLDSMTRRVYIVRKSVELNALIEEHDLLNGQLLRDVASQFSYPMLVAVDFKWNESGAYFFPKAVAHGGSCFGVFHYTQFLKYETPKKELKMYDAIAELLKA